MDNLFSESSLNEMNASKRQKVEDFPPSLFRPLNQVEKRMWMHKTAADFAAQGFSPMDQVRLLGVKEFIIILHEGSTTIPPPPIQHNNVPYQWTRNNPTKPRIPTKAQAQKIMESDLLRGHTTTNTVQDLQKAWTAVQKRGMPNIYWDDHGDLLTRYLCCEHFRTVHQLLRSGLLEGEALAFMKALSNLSSPEGLYNIPLVVAYPKLIRGQGRTLHLKVGVYANRLLFEVLTGPDLALVLNSLDSCATISKPLEAVPAGPKSFDSSPFPKLVYTRKDLKDAHEEETRQDSVLYAFSNSGFLRLIENHGVDVSIWPELQPKLNLQLELMLHQIHGLCWMYKMEHLDRGLNGLIWEERQFPDGGSFYYTPSLGQLRLCLGQPHLPAPKVNGGILADEMGLGKTIQVLALIMATLNDLKKEGESRSDHNHATLIVVPPALVTQWLSEIEKVTGDKLVYQFFDHDTLEFRTVSKKKGPADIVVTTYNALEKYSKRNKTRSAQILKATSWGRIVLDEMQEVRSSTSAIAKNCESLLSNRRWMLSGTPLFEGVQDFKGELCFLRLEPFAGNCEDGFFDFAIKSHWEAESMQGLERLRVLSRVMLRRAKTMTIHESGLPILGLKPLKVIFEPVSQDPSERAIYCFIESLVHERARGTMCDDDDGQDKNGEKTSHILLRFLRELCLSASLLNGGMGCSCQLNSLNHLMVESNRQFGDQIVGADAAISLSCDEAIRYLSQVSDTARVDEDFVTDVNLGGGGGASRRARAIESPEQLLEECTKRLLKTQSDLRRYRKALVKKRWQKALELVTTGQIGLSLLRNVKPQYRLLWSLRFATLNLLEGENFSRNSGILSRGCRPLVTKSVRYNLAKRFIWADPYCLYLSNIPTAMTTESLAKLAENSSSIGTKIRVDVMKGSNVKKYSAYVSFSGIDDYRRLLSLIRRKHGLPTGIDPTQLDWLDRLKSKAETKLEDAKASFKVYECHLNRVKLSEAEEDLKYIQEGLRIMSAEHHSHDHILCEPAINSFREHVVSSSVDFCQSLGLDIEDLRGSVAVLRVAEERDLGRKKILEGAIDRGVTAEMQSTSAFEQLQMLRDDNKKSTACSVCLGYLGESSNGLVSLTRCGHLFCKSCLTNYCREKVSVMRPHPPCITCRKPVVLDAVRTVDPSKVEDREEFAREREAAKSLVQRIAKALDESNGQLKAEMWKALYLSMELPQNAHNWAHNVYTAIPSHFLAHLNAATKLRTAAAPKDQVKACEDLSSKLRALLEDVPRDELSVVFASSKQSVKHVITVLEFAGIECRGLFSGQSEQKTEHAIEEWQAANSVRVLVVQAGAAACGLTLTAASKMFIMEPFLKHEEEKQAYARLHRYGQTKEVICKVYYTPVSVESRLLEWRKRAEVTPEDDEEIVYAKLREQTRFLLGVDN